MIDIEHDRYTFCMVDDDEIQHFLFKQSMYSQGITDILSFQNGEEAIAFIRLNLNKSEILPDIVFLDLNMPVVNGWQFLKQYAEIKEKIKKQIRIYLLSSSINPDEISAARSNPEVLGFLSKPLKPEDIKQLLDIN